MKKALVPLVAVTALLMATAAAAAPHVTGITVYAA